jgi:hypothetical protein
MIAVCEPCCSVTNHETPNAGFIAALTKCFPDEEIVFYGEKRHFDIVRGILEKKSIATNMIRFRQIFTHEIYGLPLSLYFCLRMLRELTNSRCPK